MPIQVTTGAMLQCSFGAASSTLQVLPVSRVMAGSVPAATIMDHIPITNISPFGMRSSIANPTVASATAAAAGVLTPYALRAGDACALTARRCHGDDRQHAGARQHLQADELVGRGESRSSAPADDGPNVRLKKSRANALEVSWTFSVA
jgi:hypothetical protein